MDFFHKLILSCTFPAVSDPSGGLLRGFNFVSVHLEFYQWRKDKAVPILQPSLQMEVFLELITRKKASL